MHLGDTPHSLTEADFQALGAATEGFSGSDVAVVVKDVLMQPIRLLREATHFRKVCFVILREFFLAFVRCEQCAMLRWVLMQPVGLLREATLFRNRGGLCASCG